MSNVLGSDGVKRCPWGNSTPDYAVYHDEEWGVPLTDDAALYERMCLESFQSGLSWLTILRKRDNFRRAFSDFQPKKVAVFGEDDVARLMSDAGIVRNQAKIRAAINNAQAIATLDQSLSDFLWSFQPTRRKARPRTLAEVPATSPESAAMAKALKKRGFAFLGPTTCYALMQAVGMVDDHVRDCWRAREGSNSS